MRKRFLISIIVVMAVVFAAGLLMMPAKSVSADVDVTIEPGQTLAVDFKYDRVWWLKFETKKDGLFRISSTGSIDTKVYLYASKDSTSSIAVNDDSGEGTNFSLTRFLEAGTYYFKVGPYSNTASVSSNDTCVTLSDVGGGEKVVEINKKNFPDDNFRAYVDSKLDVLKDGYLTSGEISVTTEIDVTSLSIENLKGIGYFSELVYLKCSGNAFASLDLTKNTKLAELYCCNNSNLKSIDLTGCSVVSRVFCYNNSNLTALKLKGCSNLSELDCYGTGLTSLNLSTCSRLYELECNNTKISTLNLSGFKNLYTLKCYGSPLSSLNVSGCTKLDYLLCNSTELTSLDVSSCTNLRSLYCEECKDLTSLKLNSSLTTLNCADCKLSSLNLSNCADLYYLNCFNCGIKKLNISSCPWLGMVYDENNKKGSGDNTYYSATISRKDCYLKFDSNTTVTTISNPDETAVEINTTNFPDFNFRNIIKGYDLNGDDKLSNLELSSITKLEIYARNIEKLDGIKYLTSLRYLDCDSNKLTSLNLSKNTKLETLKCANNKLTKLSLSSNTKITSLYCGSNKLSALDLSKLTGLKYLDCDGNTLSSLDLSKNTKLEMLYCFDNKLKTIDLSKNVALEEFVCDSNYLTKLDLSKNTNLLRLSCGDNIISSLDLSKNTKLENLLCYSNKLTKLNISKNTKLVACICSGNDITKLDISACPNLVKAYKEGGNDDNVPYDYYFNYYYGYYGMFSPAGSAGVSYRFYDNIGNSFMLNVDKRVKIIADVTISLDKKTANVVCGMTITLKATTNSTNAVSWKSSDTKIATVDSTGKITGKQAGKVTITATVSGKSAKCTVTVLYKDVTKSSDFWYAPTNYLTAKGVVKGYANQTEFRPANNCTRAQMVTFLYRLQGEPKTKSNKCQFEDVKSTDYFFKPVIWAVEKGITTGVSAKKFNPQGVCTRAQTVTFLWRMAGKPEPGKNVKKFPDVKTKDYFYKATLWASEKKILAGLPDGTFNPQGKCLRRQMVTFLYKYDKYINGKG